MEIVVSGVCVPTHCKAGYGYADLAAGVTHDQLGAWVAVDRRSHGCDDVPEAAHLPICDHHASRSFSRTRLVLVCQDWAVRSTDSCPWGGVTVILAYGRQPMAGYVFISYAHEDREYVEKLVHYLRA